MNDALKALVADDHPEMLEAVAGVLESDGYQVVKAANGVELIDAVGEQGPFDLIVSDISMPWMTGMNVMTTARYFGIATPVVMMTALTAASVPGEVRRLGEHAVLLRKPFDLNELRKAIAAAVGSS